MLKFLFRPIRSFFLYLHKQYLFIKIQSSNYDRRFEASYSLQENHGLSAVDGLIYLLKSKDADVRQDVAYTLERITGKYNGDSYKKWKKWWKRNRKRIT